MVSQASTEPARPLRVLVVDDDCNTITAITRLLRVARYEAIGVTESRSAVDTARELRPDVVICDVAMPDMDGYEVLRAMKRDPRTAVIPFIFLSGQSDREHVRQGMGLGADDYLTKPCESRDLLDSISARIERQRVISQKLEALQQSLTQSVPHEFFTPLNVILGFSMVVLDNLRSNEEIPRDDLVETMTSIKEAGEQLHRIASNYVLYTQLATAAARLESRTTPASPEGPEPDLGRTVRKLAISHDRVPDVHYSFQPAAVAASGEHVEKIVTELLDNALKFSRAGGWVSITGVVESAAYLIRVIDHGPGMTDAQIEALAPHVQLDRPKQVQPGVGLGLAIVRLLANRYGGSLQIARNAGPGLTLSVRLPLRSAACAA